MRLGGCRASPDVRRPHLSLDGLSDPAAKTEDEAELGDDEQRTDGFASPGGIVGGERHLYTAPKKLGRNQWGLSGTWTVDDRRARAEAAGGRIVYRFHARDLNLVMGPATRGGAARFRVLLDGKPPGPSHGVDVDEAGNGTAKDQRMYQLIRQVGPIGDRQFEIEFLDPGAEAWSFTFG